MEIISVNIGQPKKVLWKGKEVETSIYKEPTDELLEVDSLGIKKDTQSDLRVHGGVDKAIYFYPSEHYAYWKGIYSNKELNWGTFGENITSKGLLENEVNIGNQYKIGSVIMEVVQPRMPCFKLGIKLGDDKALKRFYEANYPGYYVKVIQEGSFSSKDSTELVFKDQYGFTVSEMSSLYWSQKNNKELLEKALNFPKLTENWRPTFEEQLRKIS